MRAELDVIGPRRQRWAFTLGCVRVVVTRPAVWRRVGYPLLTLAVLAASLRGNSVLRRFQYSRARAGASRPLFLALRTQQMRRPRPSEWLGAAAMLLGVASWGVLAALLAA